MHLSLGKKENVLLGPVILLEFCAWECNFLLIFLLQMRFK